jgi:NADH-quinone oxidoreductase subunit J
MVYAGAILVLFLFVIMLLSLRENEIGGERPWPVKLLAGIGAAVMFCLLAAAVLRAPFGPAPAVSPSFGSPDAIGKSMFSEFVLPFEIVSVLILAATMGAVVLAKRNLERPAAAPPEAGHGGGHP